MQQRVESHRCQRISARIQEKLHHLGATNVAGHCGAVRGLVAALVPFPSGMLLVQLLLGVAPIVVIVVVVACCSNYPGT